MKPLSTLSLFCLGLACFDLNGQAAGEDGAAKAQSEKKGDIKPDQKREFHEALVRSIEDASKAAVLAGADFNLLTFRPDGEGNQKPEPDGFTLYYHPEEPRALAEKVKEGLLKEIKSNTAEVLPVIPPDKYVALFDKAGNISSVLLVFEEGGNPNLTGLAVGKPRSAARIKTGGKSGAEIHLFQVIGEYDFLAVPVKRETVTDLCKRLAKP